MIELALVSLGDWSWMSFAMLVTIWCFTVYILLGIIKISVDPNEHDESSHVVRRILLISFFVVMMKINMSNVSLVKDMRQLTIAACRNQSISTSSVVINIMRRQSFADVMF